MSLFNDLTNAMLNKAASSAEPAKMSTISLVEMAEHPMEPAAPNSTPVDGFVESLKAQANQAMEAARPRIDEAVSAAKEKAGGAFENARPKVEGALGNARRLADESYESARPKAEATFSSLRDKASGIFGSNIGSGGKDEDSVEGDPFKSAFE